MIHDNNSTEGGIFMRALTRLATATAATIAFAHSAHAVVIDSVVGTGGTALADEPPVVIFGNEAEGAGGVRATFDEVGNFDIGLGFVNDGCTYGDGGFAESCVSYSVSLELTNGTDTDWTDFHLRVGYGGLWTDGNDDYPLFDEGTFDQSDGVDQPLLFSAISAGGSAIQGTPGDENGEEPPTLGIFDVGIDWIFDETIAVGDSVLLSFSVILGDVTGQTNWNTDGYGYPPDSANAQGGYVLTARLYPTIAPPAAVPEPGTLALFAAGLAGFGVARRRLVAA